MTHGLCLIEKGSPAATARVLRVGPISLLTRAIRCSLDHVSCLPSVVHRCLYFLDHRVDGPSGWRSGCFLHMLVGSCSDRLRWPLPLAGSQQCERDQNRHRQTASGMCHAFSPSTFHSDSNTMPAVPPGQLGSRSYNLWRYSFGAPRPLNRPTQKP